MYVCKYQSIHSHPVAHPTGAEKWLMACDSRITQGMHGCVNMFTSEKNILYKKKCNAQTCIRNKGQFALQGDILEDFENASPYSCTFLSNHICD